MLITALTIENFKGVSSPARIEFKPITLLFGPNSAGKSTIIQSLHYAREIFVRENVDAGRTSTGGETIDLGGFESLVHGHDLSRSIRLKFDLDLSRDDFPELLPRKADGKFPQYIDELVEAVGHASRRAKTAWVEIVISWSETLQRPFVESYEVGLNGALYGKIVSSKDTRQIAISYLNPSLNTDDDIGVNPELPEMENMGVEGQKSALPDFDLPLQLTGLDYGNDDNVSDYLSSYGVAPIQAILVGTGQLLRDELKRLRYLGPLREIPARNYHLARSPDESRWASGIAAWDVLHQASREFVASVNAWLSQEDRLNTGYRIEVKRFKELEVESPVLLALERGDLLDEEEMIQEEIAQLPVKVRLFLRDLSTGVEVLPQDIGVGISQVLPVVVACLSSRYGIVAIEQPELHIHPAFQVAIGDLFIEQAQTNQSIYLLETHSEHLLLRLLRRIRETSEGELPPGIMGLTPKELSVNYLEKLEDDLCIRQLQVTADGDSQGEWPKGFFEERAGELF